MADEAIYRCINDACGRPAPRRVNYCPWCGTEQTRAGVRAAAAVAASASAATPAMAATAAPAAPAAAASAAPPVSAAPAAAAAAAPSASDFGRTGKGATPQAGAAQATASPAGAAQTPPPQEVPRPPLAPHPPQRRPIRLRWWLLALALLWTVWLLAKPSPRKYERRIEAAIAIARECKGSEAQGELIALRKTNATPEQLQRLQTALNEEAAACTRRRQRAKAWSETSGAVETALAAASWDKARTRLQAFTKRWGEDDATRTLRTRIEDLRREDEEHRTHPLAAPPPVQREGMTQ